MGVGAGYWLDTKSGVYNARIGFDVAKQPGLTHSLEAEALYGRDKEQGVRTEVSGLLANYKLTFENANPVYATVGGGIGMARTRLKYFWFDDSDTSFTYQLIGTVGYKLNPQWAIEGSVRYLNIGEATIGSITADVGDDTSLEVGLKFRF